MVQNPGFYTVLITIPYGNKLAQRLHIEEQKQAARDMQYPFNFCCIKPGETP
jgi:hypothetical protein